MAVGAVAFFAPLAATPTPAPTKSIDLAVACASTVSASPGTSVVVPLSWTNRGATAVGAVSIRYTPPLGTTIDATKLGSNWTLSGRTAIYLGTTSVAAGATRQASLTIKVPVSVTASLLVGGLLTGYPTGGGDVAPSNNQANSRLQVIPLAKPSVKPTPKPTRTTTTSPTPIASASPRITPSTATRTTPATTPATATKTPSPTRASVSPTMRPTTTTTSAIVPSRTAMPQTTSTRPARVNTSSAAGAAGAVGANDTVSLAPSTYVVGGGGGASLSHSPGVIQIVDEAPGRSVAMLPLVGALTCFTLAGMSAAAYRRRRDDDEAPTRGFEFNPFQR